MVGLFNSCGQSALLRAKPAPGTALAGELQSAIATAREQVEGCPKLFEYEAAEYARALALKLGTAGHPLSTRRVVALARNVVALRAAHLALGHDAAAQEDAFFDAARFSIPDAAWGKPVDGKKLLTAHRAAWEVAHLAAGSPLRALLTETDPLRLIALSLQPGIEPAEAGSVLTDAFASLPKPARLVTAAVLFPRLRARSDLPAVALEGVAAECARVAKAGTERVVVRRSGADWKRDFLSTQLAGLDTRTQRGRVLQNAAITLLAEDERFELGDLVRALDRALEVFGPRRRAGSAKAAEEAA